MNTNQYAFHIKTDKVWQGKPGQKNIFRLFYVLKGSFKLSCMMKTHKIHENQAVIIKKNDRISIARSESQDIEFYELGFDTDSLSLPDFTLLDSVDPSLSKNLLDLICLNNLDRQSLIALFLSTLAESKNTSAVKIVADSKNYILNNADRAISTAEIAQITGVSPTTLAKYFTDIHGDSIKAFVNECRINYIKSLLDLSILPIKDIAEISGFYDTNSFTKFFKYQTHISPSEYRKK